MVRGVHDLHAGWGEKVRELREERGLSVRELARRCDVHHTTILRIETGQLCPHDALKWRLAGVLGERMDVLWAWPRIVPPVEAA